MPISIYAPPPVSRSHRSTPRIEGVAYDYLIRTYDVADDPGKDGDWAEIARGPSLMALRPVLCDLLARGYDNPSIAVDRYP